MAVAIRLARHGSKKRPFYRVVAAHKSSPRDGRFIELLGVYDPRAKVVRIDRERYARWLENGAKPSPTVASLARKLAKEDAGTAPPAASKTTAPEQAAS